MNIVSQGLYNQRIEVVELIGGLNGSESIELKNWLFSTFDETVSRNIILNFERVGKIDGLGIAMLEYILRRGVNIRLINVGQNIRCMIEMSGKDHLFEKIYNESDNDMAAALFEKEVSEEGKVSVDYTKMRVNPRINTMFPIDIKCLQPESDNLIICKAKALNLSESGLFVSDIKAIDMEDRRVINKLDFENFGTYELKFNIDGNGGQIETQGECVWRNKSNEKLGMGIRFMNMPQYHKDMIKNYVYNYFLN